MTFDEEVRSYLERIERGEQDAAVHGQIDEERLRDEFLARFAALQQRSPDLVLQEPDFWRERLGEVAQSVEAIFGLGLPLDEDRYAFACWLLDGRMPMPMPDLSGRRTGPSAIKSYSLENGLVRFASRGEVATTQLGRAFLRLRGKDAVQWLLTVEVVQSHGAGDRSRTSRDVLDKAMARGLTKFFNTPTLRRLVHLKVLERSDDRDDHYRVTEEMRDVVQNVLDAGPWHTAVAALLADEGTTGQQPPGKRAADATAEQARLIAHEVRNALVPVRHHIDALLSVSSEHSRSRLELSRRGVVRVLDFVDEMIATSELIAEPATFFEMRDMFREMLAWLDDGERVELEIEPESMRIRVPRWRLLRALSNIVNNALQAAMAPARVRIRATQLVGVIEIAVDDAGPGVPEEHRLLVFRDGYTTRHEGRGFGLAYARRVVEDELRGKIHCEHSDLGGARFVIALPKSDTDR